MDLSVQKILLFYDSLHINLNYCNKKTTLLNKNNNISLQGQQNQLLSKSQVHFNYLCVIQQWLLYSLHKEWSFLLTISSVNVTKSTNSCAFVQICWKNPYWKTSYFVWGFNQSQWLGESYYFSIIYQKLLVLKGAATDMRYFARRKFSRGLVHKKSFSLIVFKSSFQDRIHVLSREVGYLSWVWMNLEKSCNQQ